MTHTDIKALHSDPQSFAHQTLTVAGWLRNVRDSKAIGFLELTDGSSFKGLQLVVDTSLPNFKEAVSLGVGAAVVAEGVLTPTPEAKQPFELKVTALRVEGSCPPDYPLQKKRHSLEFLRTIAHLRPRANTFQAVFRVRSEAAFAIHDFFHRRGFVYVHTPIITGNDCEGAGEMFRVTTLPSGKSDAKEDFFGKPASLTVSGQLEAETFAQAFSKTYTFGPTFRAENSNTPRHAAEFWMIEPEIAFADLDDDMRLAEDMVKSVIRHVMDTCPDELSFFNGFVDTTLLERLKTLLESDFARLSYTEAIDLLLKADVKFDYPVSWGCDLQTEHERYLCEKITARPLFLTDYPKEIKAFYMRLNDDGKTVAAMDLLVPSVGELIGGSQREEREDVLRRRLLECGLDDTEYGWYLDLRRFGSTHHAGFGLGFERLVMYLTGMGNIRDVCAYPRTAGHL